jgi:4-aminobutyrate--pyruvate transaminase
VAREAIAIYQGLELADRTRELEPVLLDGLRDRLGEHPNVGDIRGVGLLAGVQLVAKRDPFTPFDPEIKFGAKVALLAEANGLIIRAIGDTIAICPPLVISEAEIELLIYRLAQAIEMATAE